MRNLFLFIFATSLLFTACEEAVFTPKPRGYPRVIYPEKAYQPFTEGYCDFTFQYPKYAIIRQDTTFFEEKPQHPCWFNIHIDAFDCDIHCSYLPVQNRTMMDKLKSDAFRMTDFHNKKATYIEDVPIQKPNDVKGMLFRVEGPVASQLQFFLTDSLEQKHFFRGSLYFNTQARPDSLAPVFDFVKQDLEKMLETFEWK